MIYYSHLNSPVDLSVNYPPPPALEPIDDEDEEEENIIPFDPTEYYDLDDLNKGYNWRDMPCR
jgi:hypothetical protein